MIACRQKRAAFTLIELLIVLTVITLLAAMLLPVLRSALETARAASSMNNLKQIGLAFSLYLDDHGSFFPDLWGTRDGTGMWYERLCNRYLEKNRLLFRCPSDRKYAWGYDTISYGYNYRGCWERDGIRQYTRLSEFLQPSKKGLAADTKSPFRVRNLGCCWRPGEMNFPNYYNMGDLHRLGANVLWIDLHLTWQAYGTVKTGAEYPP